MRSWRNAVGARPRQSGGIGQDLRSGPFAGFREGVDVEAGFVGGVDAGLIVGAAQQLWQFRTQAGTFFQELGDMFALDTYAGIQLRVRFSGW